MLLKILKKAQILKTFSYLRLNTNKYFSPASRENKADSNKSGSGGGGGGGSSSSGSHNAHANSSSSNINASNTQIISNNTITSISKSSMDNKIKSDRQVKSTKF